VFIYFLVIFVLNRTKKCMKTITFEIDDVKSDIWQTLPPVCQNLLANKALNSILSGVPYPTGTDQLELAIELAENGIDASVITKVSGLDRSLFESFMPR
jgi:hypothetical protein